MAVDSQTTIKYPKFLTFASLPTRKQIVLLEIDFNLSLAMGIYFSINKKRISTQQLLIRNRAKFCGPFVL